MTSEWLGFVRRLAHCLHEFAVLMIGKRAGETPALPAEIGNFFDQLKHLNFKTSCALYIAVLDFIV